MKRVWLTAALCAALIQFSIAQQTAVKHTVKPGETLYAVSKKYNVSIADLSKANNLQANEGLKVGQILMIPGKSTTASPTTAAPTVKAKLHTVATGESLFAIARLYGVTVNDLKQWNNLKDTNLKPGQKLVVNKANALAYYQPAAVPSTPDTPYSEEDKRKPMPATDLRPVKNIDAEEILGNQPDVESSARPTVTTGLRTNSANVQEYPVIFNNYPASGFKIKKNRGTANFLNDVTNGNQYLAFYNDAESGSIIRITNMLNQKTIFVKVVGRIPATEAHQEVMLKLTTKAAEELGVSEEKFLVEVASYGY